MGVRLSVSVEPLLPERGQVGRLPGQGGDSSGHIEEELEDSIVQLFVVRREF